MDYKAVYENVMKVDSKIRFATIFDTNGKILQTGHREGAQNLLTPEESKRSLEQAVNIWKLRSELAPKIGKGQYVLAAYEKIKRITMPLDDEHLLYVTAEANADHSTIINGLLKIKAELK
jgi:hypothetical protein